MRFLDRLQRASCLNLPAGTIPHDLSSLTNLVVLRLNNNKLEGESLNSCASGGAFVAVDGKHCILSVWLWRRPGTQFLGTLPVLHLLLA